MQLAQPIVERKAFQSTGKVLLAKANVDTLLVGVRTGSRN